MSVPVSSLLPTSTVAASAIKTGVSDAPPPSPSPSLPLPREVGLKRSGHHSPTCGAGRSAQAGGPMGPASCSQTNEQPTLYIRLQQWTAAFFYDIIVIQIMDHYTQLFSSIGVLYLP